MMKSSKIEKNIFCADCGRSLKRKCECGNVKWVIKVEKVRELLAKQKESEIKFLNCQGVKYLIHEADLGACHEDSRTINNRKKKLKRELDDLTELEETGGKE